MRLLTFGLTFLENVFNAHYTDNICPKLVPSASKQNRTAKAHDGNGNGEPIVYYISIRYTSNRIGIVSMCRCLLCALVSTRHSAKYFLFDFDAKSKPIGRALVERKQKIGILGQLDPNEYRKYTKPIIFMLVRWIYGFTTKSNCRFDVICCRVRIFTDSNDGLGTNKRADE